MCVLICTYVCVNVNACMCVCECASGCVHVCACNEVFEYFYNCVCGMHAHSRLPSGTMCRFSLDHCMHTILHTTVYVCACARLIIWDGFSHRPYTHDVCERILSLALFFASIYHMNHTEIILSAKHNQHTAHIPSCDLATLVWAGIIIM